MFRLAMAFTGIVLLLGCTSKEETALMESYTKKINYHKQLQKTEKTQLYENNVTKVMMTATYLYTPTEDKNDTRDEAFIVGVHLENEALEEFSNLLATAHPRITKWLENEIPINEVIESIKKVTRELNLDFAQLLLFEIEDEETEVQEQIFKEFRGCF